MKKEKNIQNIRHSLAHLLGATVQKKWPGAKLAIGPAVDNGFYYDVELSEPISDKDIRDTLEPAMKTLGKSWDAFTSEVLTESKAKKLFADNPYKIEIIDEIVKGGETITVYKSGDFTDLCRGGHVSSMKEVDPDGWKLDRVAGAYWRGDEKNKMLTRIYGLAFNSKTELDKYEEEREEAKKNDHKKLGRELDLFTFSELVGAGLPLFTPKGTILRDLLDDEVWQLRKQYGYKRVDIPHITKKDLYQKSGHWDKFGNELFHVSTREGHEFVMKPMNCPHHTQIFARKSWSYREMPERYASTTKVYRDEQSGELAGISRVRAITQDDAHVFCRKNQVKDEIRNIWNIVETFYGMVGFTNLVPRLSLHDPEKMRDYLGSEPVWQTAENELRQLVEEKKVKAVEAVGEAAFYGPKIDFLAKDSLGREWQVATIQLDMNMPERFDLFCTNEKGERERIVMIHAAIMGSIERFLSIIIEHFAGNFPVWLSPVQVKVLPVNENHFAYAKEIAEKLSAENFRVEADLGDEGLGKKVRAAKQEKVPYFIIIGDKDIEAKKVTLESRDSGNIGQMSIDAVIDRLLGEAKK